MFKIQKDKFYKNEVIKCIDYYSKNTDTWLENDEEEILLFLNKCKAVNNWFDNKIISNFINKIETIETIEIIEDLPTIEDTIDSTKLSLKSKEIVKSKKSEYKKYERKCRLLTKTNAIGIGEGYNMCVNFEQLYSKEHYVIDHKFSVFYGYTYNVPIEEIASLQNLRVITTYDNLRKSRKIFIDSLNENLKKYLPSNFKNYSII